MIISMVKYLNTFFPKPDLTRILCIPTYDSLHQINLKLKTNALSVHSNLRGATHRNLVLLMKNTKYATMSNVPYICPMHPGVLLITNNSIRATSYRIKRVYDENLQVFHKVWGYKQALIQQFSTAVNKQHIISIKNLTRPVYGQHTSDFCVPPCNVRKNTTNSSERFQKRRDRNA